MTVSCIKWYAVYTQPRREHWTRSNLWERGHEVYLPLYHRQRRHARRTDWVSAPLFPRYLFVTNNPTRPGRRSILSAPGVISLVTFGDRPATVADTIIQDIRSRENDTGHVQLMDAGSLIPGEQVRIHSGIMTDQVGLFERGSDADRVVILLQLLGREVRARMPSSSISRTL